jgi:hypothetical protein
MDWIVLALDRALVNAVTSETHYKPSNKLNFIPCILLCFSIITNLFVTTQQIENSFTTCFGYSAIIRYTIFDHAIKLIDTAMHTIF